MTRIAPLIILALISPLATSGPSSDVADDSRVNRSVEGFTAQFGERGSATTQQLKQQSTLAAEALSRPRSLATSVSGGNAWIFDADAVLYDDFDDDGYFRYLSVRFDADTYLPGMYVYAMLYLSADGEIWEHYYTTEDFLIDGTVPDDEYFVETELLEGYPPGLYDVLIELYDADYFTFEDEFGPAQSSALGLLPIEDATYDVPPVQVTLSSGHGGGGTMSPWFIGALLLLALAGRLRARRPLTATAKGIYCARLETRP